MYTKRRTKGNDLEDKMKKIGKAESVGVERSVGVGRKGRKGIGVDLVLQNVTVSPSLDRTHEGCEKCETVE